MARSPRTLKLEDEIQERLDNARAALSRVDVYGTGYGVTLADIVEAGVRDELAYLEKRHNGGKPFPKPRKAHRPARRLAGGGVALLLLASTASASPAPVVYVHEAEPLSLIGSPMAVVCESGPSIKIDPWGPMAWLPFLTGLLW